MNRSPYKSVFAYASYQFCGHVPKYLKGCSERLCLFYFETHFGKKKHRVECYENGRLVGVREHASSHNVFLYYLLQFVWGNVELWRFAAGTRCRTLAFCGHPVNLFALGIHRLLHRTVYSYWIGDYFPSRHPVLRAFERVKKFYHDRVDFAWYLSDPINAIENGAVRDDAAHKTVAWGVRMHEGCDADRAASDRILFVGLLRAGQGIEDLLAFMADNPQYTLSIIGEAAGGFDAEIARLIAARGLGERVFFPNRFYSQEELIAEARRAFVGVALYDRDAGNFTHYADPGKVKAYLEMGLPVVMTRISDVVRHVERFGAGVVVESPAEAGEAIRRIRARPEAFRRGVADFVAHFDYARYYGESFRAFGGIWK